MGKTHPDAHPTQDEYHWPAYTKEYAEQVKHIENAPHLRRSFVVKQSKLTDNGFEFKDNFHPNWMQIYNSIYQCDPRPKTVFECGCGGLYHLYNIKTFFPDIEVAGCDLLQSQIDFGASKFNISPSILNNVKVVDFASDNAHKKLDKYDFVFSHAVMMHLSKNKAIKFLNNMINISNKYIFFIEGDQHNYVELLKQLNVFDKYEITNPADFKGSGKATLLRLR